MSPQIQYASFLIRLWRLPGLNERGTSACWQSEVEHIQSGKTWSFNTLEDLCAFLQQQPQADDGLAWVEIQVTESPGMEVPEKFLRGYGG